jgi:hypothetical protein
VIKSLIKQYEKRQLEKLYKKQGFNSLEAYTKHTDVHINKRGTTIAEWYIGYAFVYKLTDPVLFVKTDEIQEWCRRNMGGKWRADWKKTAMDSDALINSGFGEEYMYFAFKTREDFKSFHRRWVETVEV